MLKFKNTLFTCLFFFAFISCSQNKENENDFFIPTHYVPVNRAESITEFMGEWPIEKQKEFHNQLEVLSHYIFSSKSWKDADQLARETLNSELLPPKWKYFYEQVISNEMLNYKLLKVENETPDLVEAISFYTELLVKNEHQDADVVTKSLVKLENHWSNEKIKQASEVTYLAAKKYFEKQKNCTDCASAVYKEIQSSNKKALVDSKSETEYKTLKAMFELKEKAGI